MYKGETKVPGDHLGRFIKAAQDLDIRGLGADQIKGTFPKAPRDSQVISVKGTSHSTPSSEGTPTTRKMLDTVRSEKVQDDSNLYEIVGGMEIPANCSFGKELSIISHRMNKLKQTKLNNINRIKESITEHYNPNDTLDSVLPQGEEEVEDTFDEEMGEGEVSTDSAMIIDGSGASDQNAQLELEISMRRTKIR